MTNRSALTLLGALLLAACGGAEETPQPATVVHDVTQLVQIPVERVVAPLSTEEVQRLVRQHDGPISIGGGRFSMGGQIATEDTLFLDMRSMDRVLAYDPAAKTVTVEGGITWRKLQEHIDGDDLSVKIMQSYSNFTVGGSLSVNSHGRYVNQGPLVHSARSIKVVLADGSAVVASPTEESELFYGAIGGYGGLGVIAEATLDLAVNEPVERVDEIIARTDYRQWFQDEIAGSSEAIFHNADIYPPDYDRAVAITFRQTDREVTVPERLHVPSTSTWSDRFGYWVVSEAPYGRQLRERVIDPARLSGDQVVWRNYEASYDARRLEPGSREASTYVLQEYFVPVDHFDDFVEKMGEIFRRYDANVVNVSIRHASADPGTLLAWAREECFAFVVYYKQGTAEHAQTEVGIWTRELIEAVISVEGTYYLPYQLHATDDQFHRAYPRAEEFFALKQRYDPQYTFRNKLWDHHLPPTQALEQAKADAEIRKKLASRDDYLRPEDQTFLTLPEWYIVYSADELGHHLKSGAPSQFPFFGSLGQYWDVWTTVSERTEGRYAKNSGYQTMLWVIGASYAGEYGLKGIYEGTVGRFTEWIDGSPVPATPEDQFIGQVAVDYGAFIHHTPFYAFPWATKRQDMWRLPGGPWSVRGVERRVSGYLELAFKSAYCGAMAWGTATAYAPEASHMLAWVKIEGDQDPEQVEGVEIVEALGGRSVLVTIPRYEPFTAAVPALAAQGIEFVEIAGNKRVLITLRTPEDFSDARLWGDVLLEWPILTEPGRKRIALEVPVARLHQVLPALEVDGVELDHVYDY